jgi:hypothetical protein
LLVMVILLVRKSWMMKDGPPSRVVARVVELTKSHVKLALRRVLAKAMAPMPTSLKVPMSRPRLRANGTATSGDSRDSSTDNTMTWSDGMNSAKMITASVCGKFICSCSSQTRQRG